MSASTSSNDLRNRIIFTIAILAVYRFGTFVPLPGIDPDQLKTLMEGNQKGLLGMFNVFAGGAVSRMAIFALGINDLRSFFECDYRWLNYYGFDPLDVPTNYRGLSK